MIALILAAGDGERWDGRFLKQLAPICGEPIIRRVVRQADEYANTVIVSHQAELQAQHTHYLAPAKRMWTVETLLSTEELWDNRVIVLLGDVIYSDNVMWDIVTNDQPVAVYGKKWELFALTFSSGHKAKVKAALNTALEDARDRGGRGKLWEFYRAYCGLPLGENVLEDEVFVMVGDYTDDIDYLTDYLEFHQRNPWAGEKSMSDIVREIGY